MELKESYWFARPVSRPARSKRQLKSFNFAFNPQAYFGFRIKVGTSKSSAIPDLGLNASCCRNDQPDFLAEFGFSKINFRVVTASIGLVYCSWALLLEKPVAITVTFISFFKFLSKTAPKIILASSPAAS